MAETSLLGLFQFSWEKVNRVSTRIPNSPAAFTTLFTAFTPALWPAVRGSPRLLAHLPLPSMMMAM